MSHLKCLCSISVVLISTLAQGAPLTVKPQGKAFTPKDLKSQVVMQYVQAFGSPEVTYVFPGTLGSGVTLKFPPGTAWDGPKALYRYILPYQACDNIAAMEDTFRGTIGHLYLQGESSDAAGEAHPNDLLVLQTYTRDSNVGSKKVHEYDFVLFVYSDRKVTIKDAAQCKNGESPTQMNMQLTLQKGWNPVWVMGKQVLKNKLVVLDSYTVRNFKGTTLKATVPFREYPDHQNP